MRPDEGMRAAGISVRAEGRLGLDVCVALTRFNGSMGRRPCHTETDAGTQAGSRQTRRRAPTAHEHTHTRTSRAAALAAGCRRLRHRGRHSLGPDILPLCRSWLRTRMPGPSAPSPGPPLQVPGQRQRSTRPRTSSSSILQRSSGQRQHRAGARAGHRLPAQPG